MLKDRDKPSLISIRDLFKDYYLEGVEIPAIRGINQEIYAGEFIAVMGPSGSGKSTCMNILGLLDRPTKGEYLLEGTNVASLTKDTLARIRNEKIGFVFQSFNLLSRTSAIENIELPLIYNSISSKERRRRAEEVLFEMGLRDWENHRPSQLSGGQQQRVAIARALVNSPSLVLADEPTGNLDSQTGKEIMKIFEVLNREKGITIVLVTHEKEIAQYGERTILFRDGLIVEDTKN